MKQSGIYPIVCLLLLCFGFFGCEKKPPEILYETLPETMAEAQTERVGEIQTESRRIVVYICGAVVRPGVVEIAAGARVYEALAKVGGFRAEAAINTVNQAAVLEDGQQITILTKEEADKLPAAVQVPESVTGVTNGRININAATAEELMTLPGIGAAKAADILKYIETFGRFKTIEEIKNISGIKDAVFNKIKDKIVAE